MLLRAFQTTRAMTSLSPLAIPPNPAPRLPVPLHKCDTPSLVICLPQVHKNLTTMRSTCQALGVDLRPHVKTHKSVELSELTLRKFATYDSQFEGGGAVGLCFQVLDELQAVLSNLQGRFTIENHGNPKLGMYDFFLTSQVTSPFKIDRLLDLVKGSQGTTLISLLVDDERNLGEIAERCAASSCQIGVFVEINVGQDRTGVPPTSLDQIIRMAETISSHPNLTYRGIHCYQGLLQHTRSTAARTSQISSSVAHARTVRDALTAGGFPPQIVTGAGTGSFYEEAGHHVHTEVQPGSYVLYDTDYRDNEQDGNAPSFDHALFIHSAIVSTAVDEKQVVVDAGSKAVDLVSGVPSFTDQSVNNGLNGMKDGRVEYTSGGDEHGILTLSGDLSQTMIEGSDHGTVRMLPRHVDPQCNLHDRYLVVEDVEEGIVTEVWNVQGRGPGY